MAFTLQLQLLYTSVEGKSGRRICNMDYTYIMWMRILNTQGYACSVTQACLCNPMDCTPTGSSVHGILQARTLEWVAISYSQGYVSPFKKIKQKNSVHFSFKSQQVYFLRANFSRFLELKDDIFRWTEKVPVKYRVLICLSRKKPSVELVIHD